MGAQRRPVQKTSVFGTVEAGQFTLAASSTYRSEHIGVFGTGSRNARAPRVSLRFPYDLRVVASPNFYKRTIVAAELRMLRLKKVLANQRHFETCEGSPSKSGIAGRNGVVK